MNATTIVVSLLAAVGLAVVHFLSGKLRFLEGIPRSIWLSMAGGRLRGYVFVHLLAELAKGQEAIAEAVDEGITFPERHVYLLALLSLTVFYGLERTAKTSHRRQREVSAGDRAGRPFPGSSSQLLNSRRTKIEARMVEAAVVAPLRTASRTSSLTPRWSGMSMNRSVTRWLMR
jgi:hypothetical protein